MLELLIANGIDVILQENNGFTPTPSVSHAMLCHNRQGLAQADGICIMRSDNPSEDGGIKYIPPKGGQADTNLAALQAQRQQFIGAALEGRAASVVG